MSSNSLISVFTSSVLNVPEIVANEENYKNAIDEMGWELVSYEALEDGQFSPVRVTVKKDPAKDDTNSFVIVRAGNSVTFGVVKEIDGVDHILVRNEKKATGIDVVTMPSGYINKEDDSIAAGAFRKLLEEADMVVDNVVSVGATTIPVANNATTTSTSFLAKVGEDSKTPDGWRWTDLKDSLQTVDHGPAHITAMYACFYYDVKPDLNVKNIAFNKQQ